MNRSARTRIIAAVIAATAVLAMPVDRSSAVDVGPLESDRGGDFVALSPARILDTRSGLGAAPGRVLGARHVPVQVTGHGGVPADGVQAVFVNATVTEPDFTGLAGLGSSEIESGRGDVASNISFRSGQTVPNLALVPVGADGRIVAALFGADATHGAHLVIDVMGYVAAAPAVGSRMVSVGPARILDTRLHLGLPGPLGAGRTSAAAGTGVLTVRGAGGVPAGATAVVLNLIGVAPTSTTFVTAYPGDLAAAPTSSNLNLVRGQVQPNVVIVKLPADGTIKLFNFDGSTDLVADVIGYFVPADGVAGDTGRIVAHDAITMFDAQGDPFDELGPNDTLITEFTDYRSVVDGQRAAGLFLNLLAESDAAGFLTVYPAGMPRPVASNLNLVRDRTVTNLVAVATGPDAQVAVYNFAGHTAYSIEVVGYVLP